MKKIFLMFCMALFLSCFVSTHQPLWAQESPEQDSSLTVQAGAEKSNSTGSAAVSVSIEYTLPFPGILPDHPLYFLKRVRDSILEFLITDPIRKAEFYILQADKRLQMGVTFQSEGKMMLAESTVSKAEKYLEQAQTIMYSYKKNGSPVPPYVIEKLEKSTAKHREAIINMIAVAGEEEQKGLDASLSRNNRIRASVQSLK